MYIAFGGMRRQIKKRWKKYKRLRRHVPGQAGNLPAKWIRSVRVLNPNTVLLCDTHSTSMSSLARTQPGIALVTGASSGIGRSAAIALGKAGWTVIICARRADALEETGQMVQNAGGREVQAMVADLSQPDDIVRLFEAIREDYGRWMQREVQRVNCRSTGFALQRWSTSVRKNVMTNG